MASEYGAVLSAVAGFEGKEHAGQGFESQVEVPAVLEPSCLVVLQTVGIIVQSLGLAEVLLYLGNDEQACGLEDVPIQLL